MIYCWSLQTRSESHVFLHSFNSLQDFKTFVTWSCWHRVLAGFFLLLQWQTSHIINSIVRYWWRSRKKYSVRATTNWNFYKNQTLTKCISVFMSRSDLIWKLKSVESITKFVLLQECTLDDKKIHYCKGTTPCKKYLL